MGEFSGEVYVVLVGMVEEEDGGEEEDGREISSGQC